LRWFVDLASGAGFFAWPQAPAWASAHLADAPWGAARVRASAATAAFMRSVGANRRRLRPLSA